MFWILDELINDGNAAIVQNRGANPQDPYIYQWATQVSLYLQNDTDLGMLQERAMGFVDDVLGAVECKQSSCYSGCSRACHIGMRAPWQPKSDNYHRVDDIAWGIM